MMGMKEVQLALSLGVCGENLNFPFRILNEVSTARFTLGSTQEPEVKKISELGESNSLEKM